MEVPYTLKKRIDLLCIRRLEVSDETFHEELQFLITHAKKEKTKEINEALEDEIDLDQLERYKNSDSALAPFSYGAGHSYGNWEMADKIFSIINEKFK